MDAQVKIFMEMRSACALLHSSVHIQVSAPSCFFHHTAADGRAL
jgi:hypothetical protein